MIVVQTVVIIIIAIVIIIVIIIIIIMIIMTVIIIIIINYNNNNNNERTLILIQRLNNSIPEFIVFSQFRHLITFTYGPRQTKKCTRTCAICTDSFHPAHAQNTIRAFALYSYIL